MDYADELPETDNPIMLIHVTAKCPVCEETERCDSPGEANTEG